jgi:hypothetical protein
MKSIALFAFFLILPYSIVWAKCEPVDLLIVGDSQSGATWSKSYFGNFLPTCLEGTFALYARGGTVPGNWLGKGAMDQIETMERTPDNFQHNIGSGTTVPECKKRIGPMLDAHSPQKILFQFGGNMIGFTDAEITKQIDLLMNEISVRGITSSQCYFVTPTFEMAVADHRNVPTRSLAAVVRVTNLIQTAINERCQLISGIEIMKNSPYFDGKELLKRVLIPGLAGCGGAAANDNVHICGEAAKDWAQRVCETLKI